METIDILIRIPKDEIILLLNEKNSTVIDVPVWLGLTEKKRAKAISSEKRSRKIKQKQKDFLEKDEDKTIKYTNLMVTAYGRKILKDRNYNITKKTNPKIYVKFQAAGLLLKKFVRKYNPSIPTKEIADLSIRAAETFLEGLPEKRVKTLYPGYLTNENVWSIHLPKLLNSTYGDHWND